MGVEPPAFVRMYSTRTEVSLAGLAKYFTCFFFGLAIDRQHFMNLHNAHTHKEAQESLSFPLLVVLLDSPLLGNHLSYVLYRWSQKSGLSKSRESEAFLSVYMGTFWRRFSMQYVQRRRTATAACHCADPVPTRNC